MEGSDNFMRWEANRGEFCARIEKVHAPIKIALVTKDDPFFIERWINHHAKIVDLENLIIFDNMSQDPKVLSVYREFKNRTNIVQFSDRHYYNVHNSRLYGELYRSLAKSSEYFIFLDTDEYLILIDGQKYYADGGVLDFVMSNRSYDFFPSTWLFNWNWSATKFGCGTSARDLANNFACGKPLIRSEKNPLGYVNHNFQLARLFAPPFKTGLFLLHFTHLFPQQRIATNLNKLIADDVAQVGETPESVAARNDITDDIMALYAREIRDCLALSGRQPPDNAALGTGCLELLPDGIISYRSDIEMRLVNEFIVNPNPVYDLIPDHYRLDAVVSAPLPTSNATNDKPWG